MGALAQQRRGSASPWPGLGVAGLNSELVPVAAASLLQLQPWGGSSPVTAWQTIALRACV